MTSIRYISSNTNTLNYDRPDGKECVISFDVSHEVFKLFPHPPVHDRYDRFAAVTNFRDSLAFIVYHRVTTTPVDIYIFEETISSACGGGWSKKYTVGPITLAPNMWFLQCFRNGDLLFKDLGGFKFVAIDAETHEIERLELHTNFHPNDSFRFRHYSTYFYPYTETLVSIKGMKQVNEEGPDILVLER